MGHPLDFPNRRHLRSKLSNEPGEEKGELRRISQAEGLAWAEAWGGRERGGFVHQQVTGSSGGLEIRVGVAYMLGVLVGLARNEIKEIGRDLAAQVWHSCGNVVSLSRDTGRTQPALGWAPSATFCGPAQQLTQLGFFSRLLGSHELLLAAGQRVWPSRLLETGCIANGNARRSWDLWF